jgi:HEAT repeat
MEDKKKAQARQGALFALETFTSGLGLIFEPFLIQMLPYLLSALGDTSTEVREAAQDASRVIMSRISGHCVKQILPLLLVGLDDRRRFRCLLVVLLNG